jgi:two-component system, cell cycle response regulator DivK
VSFMEPRAKVLIIEDNADLLGILEQLLSRDYQVSTARRGEEGVALALAEKPDVVILDLHLPKMDGIEAGRWIKRELGDQVAILVLTALAGKGEPETVLQSGCCDAYMAKPASLDAIRSRVAELLASGTSSGTRTA